MRRDLDGLVEPRQRRMILRDLAAQESEAGLGPLRDQRPQNLGGLGGWRALDYMAQSQDFLGGFVRPATSLGESARYVRGLAGETVALRRGGGEALAQIVALARDRIGLRDDLRFLEGVTVALGRDTLQLLLQFADIDDRRGGRRRGLGKLVIVRQGCLLSVRPDSARAEMIRPENRTRNSCSKTIHIRFVDPTPEASSRQVQVLSPEFAGGIELTLDKPKRSTVAGAVFGGVRAGRFQQRQTVMRTGETMFARGAGELGRGGPLKRRQRVILDADRAALSACRRFASAARARQGGDDFVPMQRQIHQGDHEGAFEKKAQDKLHDRRGRRRRDEVDPKPRSRGSFAGISFLNR